MYRLFKIASSRKTNINLPPSPSVLPCTLCNRENFVSGNRIFVTRRLIRNFSTEDLNPERNSIKKPRKLKKHKKKYAELVEVSDDCSNLTKAVIKKLSANDVSQLTKKPEISLEKFHQLLNKSKKSLSNQVNLNGKSTSDKPKSSTVSNIEEKKDYLLSKINLSPVNDDNLRERIEKETEWELIQHDTENVAMFSNADPLFCNSFPDEEPSVSSVSKKKKKTKRASNSSTKLNNEASISEKTKPKDRAVVALEECRKVDKFNENLSSYIELCVQCDFLSLGLGTLHRYHRLQRFNDKKMLNSPQPFNILLQGYASKANVDKIMQVMSMMVDCEVSFTPQTFAACFECCGRLPASQKHAELLKSFHEQFTSHGITFQDLMTKCSYVRDQRDFVMKAVKAIDEHFTPHYEFVNEDYSYPFLQDLNEKTSVRPSPAENLLTDHELSRCIMEQTNTELQTYLKIKSAMKPDKITPRIEFCRSKWKDLENSWRKSIKEALIRGLNDIELMQNQTKSSHSINIYPYLKVLSLDAYVDIIMMEIRKLLLGSETFSPYLRILHKELGKHVKNRYDIKFKQQSGVISKVSKMYKDYCKWYLHPETNQNSRNTRHQWQHLCDLNATSGPTITDNAERHWPPSITLEVGKFLYDIIINSLKVDANLFTPNNKKTTHFVPAFYSLYRYQGSYLIEEVKPSPVLSKLFKETCADELHFDINFLPMVSPPVPWTSPISGGYVFTKTDFMRLYNFPVNPVMSAPNKQLLPVFDSLNQLASVPWRINVPVLEVMLKVFRDGGSKKLKVPLSDSSFECEGSNNELSPHERNVLSRKKSEMYSLWCESLYRLSLADHFRNRIFWLPHNMDFRGRVYPVPPHLTHLGSDLARALLRFAKGEKLGPKGLDWLKIHCINLTGLKKKESIAERLRYADEVLPKILDSAEKPLTGEMWWAEADEDIWQILACCFEIKAALDSGDAENFVSHFPVHQDGSCNGLQHYAALGRDQEGGASVNLTPADKPQDVYSCIVNLVEEQRRMDAQNGIEIAQQLEGFIKRKVIKQTIMTTVYGVTRYGARLQIAKQLKDIEDFPRSLVWSASTYLVGRTFSCLRDMFTSTKEIQDWFTDCAKIISGQFGKFVEWETPLGLPVIQPYCKSKKAATSGVTVEIGHAPTLYLLQPNTMKQKNAFPPNFIHSLDSSHMMLTSLFCEKEGITFVSVHDCFWTHPSSVEMMNKICREQFVTLHSLPILENLSDYFTKKHIRPTIDVAHGKKTSTSSEDAETVFSGVPKKGSLNLEDVRRSQFFFS